MDNNKPLLNLVGTGGNFTCTAYGALNLVLVVGLYGEMLTPAPVAPKQCADRPKFEKY